jgi:chromosome segregation ATPase
MTRTPLALALAAALFAAACSSGSDELSADAQWADGICTARADLDQSVAALNDSLSFESGSGSSLEQAQTQVTDRVEAVRTSAADLKAAIEDVPADAESEIAAAQQELQTASADVQESLTAVGAALTAASSAGSAGDFITALAQVATAASATKNAVTQLADDLSGFRESGNEQVKQAFADAPSCQTGN